METRRGLHGGSRTIVIPLLPVLVFAVLSLVSCRPEAYEQNRQALIDRAQISGADPETRPEALRLTRESYVDLVIGLNTFRHERPFISLAETLRYLEEVIFNGRMPREFLKGQNRIVDAYDGSGGWVLRFIPEDPGFRLELNVANAKSEQVKIYLKDK